jgi:hypothetical protein
MSLKSSLKSLKSPVEGVYFFMAGELDLRGRVHLSPEEKRLVARFLGDFLLGVTGERAPGHLYFRLAPEGVYARGKVVHPRWKGWPSRPRRRRWSSAGTT